MKRLRFSREQQLRLLASDVWRPVIAALISAVVLWPAERTYVSLFGEDSQTDLSIGFSFLGFFLFGVAYAFLCYIAFDRLNADQLQRVMKESDLEPGAPRWKRLLRGGSGTVWALTFSVLAVVAVLTVGFLRSQSEGDSGYVTTPFGLATVIGAWFLNAVSFALHYSREDASRQSPGFRFPDDRKPVWSDYTYVAFKICTSFATADVECLTTDRRRLVTRHSILSFAFNTIILAQLVAIIVPN